MLNDLYETNFFKNITINFKEQILLIAVEENPIIEVVNYNGIKSNKILELIVMFLKKLVSYKSFNTLFNLMSFISSSLLTEINNFIVSSVILSFPIISILFIVFEIAVDDNSMKIMKTNLKNVKIKLISFM